VDPAGVKLVVLNVLDYAEREHLDRERWNSSERDITRNKDLTHLPPAERSLGLGKSPHRRGQASSHWPERQPVALAPANAAGVVGVDTHRNRLGLIGVFYNPLKSES